MSEPLCRPAEERRILIVGGGATGVLLATQVLRLGRGKVDVTILEGGSMLGLGVAYLTTDPLHLLDPRVIYMLADPERPEHFLDRLRARDEGEADPQGFVSRAA